LGVNVGIGALNGIPYVGSVLSIGAGAFELSGGFNTIYNKISNRPLINYSNLPFLYGK
jgi:hypothetical protein